MILITKQLLEKTKKNKQDLVYDLCYNDQKNLKEHEEKIKKAKEITIYDITYNDRKKEGDIVSVLDHINKTGKNPLVRKNETPVFVDISNLYINNKKGLITTCLGENYNNFYKQVKNPSSDLCLISIWCHSINPNIKIKARLINFFNNKQ